MGDEEADQRERQRCRPVGVLYCLTAIQWACPSATVGSGPVAGPLLARGGRGGCGGGVPAGLRGERGRRGGARRGGWRRPRPRLAAGGGGGGPARSNRSGPRRAERPLPEAPPWRVARPASASPGLPLAEPSPLSTEVRRSVRPAARFVCEVSLRHSP